MSTLVISADEISALALRAGFKLTPEQAAEYVEAYGYIAEMATRIRGNRSYMAEPAHTFTFAGESKR